MIDPKTAALVVIDMQHGFVDADSALGVAGAAATVPACKKALEQARKLGMRVVHMVRDYAPDGSDVEAPRFAAWAAAGKPLSSACVNAKSRDEVEGLEPVEGERVMVKPRYSAFFDTELDLVLRRWGVGTVVLMGTATPNCVRTTCYDAISLDYNVVVLEDCTSSRTPEVQQANIDDMRFAGAHIMDSDEFCDHGLAAAPDVVSDVRAEIVEFA